MGEGPSYPDYVDADLKAIRPTFRIVWNPTSHVIPGSFDAFGRPTGPRYEGRYELWDTDAEGADYRVMRVQTDDGRFRLPGEWLVSLLKLLNPERWGGDPGRMLREMVDTHNEQLRQLHEKDFEDLIETVVKSYWDYFQVKNVGKPQANKRPVEA